MLAFCAKGHQMQQLTIINAILPPKQNTETLENFRK